MNGFEITCLVSGVILLFNTFTMTKGTTKDLLIVMGYNVARLIVSACLILLPLYFNYWRK